MAKARAVFRAGLAVGFFLFQGTDHWLKRVTPLASKGLRALLPPNPAGVFKEKLVGCVVDRRVFGCRRWKKMRPRSSPGGRARVLTSAVGPPHALHTEGSPMSAPLPNPVHVPDSFGHWSGTRFNAAFQVALPGWPHQLTQADLHPVPNGGFAALSPKGSSQPGDVWLRVELPNDRQQPALRITAHVTTDRQGIFASRRPTNDELGALHAHWFDLRDAVLTGYDTPHHGFLDNEEAARCFERVEILFVTNSAAIRTDGPGSHAVLITPKAGARVVRPAPPLPTLASSLPVASESPQASDLQRDFQKAITEAEGDLSSMGNGYAWAVAMVLDRLSGPMSKHMPGFHIDDYRFSDG
jgi:hypothetical protein